MRKRFGDRQCGAVLVTVGSQTRMHAATGKNVAVTTRKLIVHQNRGVSPGLVSDRQTWRQSGEEPRGDHYHSLGADAAREAYDVAFALAGRLQREVFAPIEKLAIAFAIVERAGCDEHLDS